jgi:1-acyl-sn-glycerol-3-phosphate acyltransferase
VPDAHLKLKVRRTVGYHLFRALVVALWTAMFRPQVEGQENIPLSGPVLIAPVHRSNIDFAFTVFMTKRKTFFMAKDSLWRIPLLRELISTMGAFPVKRGTADRESLAFAQSVLEQGEVLVMFPEGTRQEGAEVSELRDGAMFIASRTGATVVPVGIGNTERAMPRGAKFPRPAKVRIVIGAPIAAPTSEGRITRTQIAESTEELRASLHDVYRRSMMN